MWTFFIKFSKKEFLQDMQSGYLYLNTVDYFKKVDIQNTHQFDPYENCNIYLQNLKVTAFEPNMNKLLFEGMAYEAIIINPHKVKQYTHIWSCFHIKKGMALRSDNKIFSDHMWQFGDYVLIITNTKMFMQRILKAIDKNNLDSAANSVQYLKKAPFVDNMNVFTKFDDYMYQSEYRIAIKTNKEFINKPYRLNIGPITDISMIIHKSKIKNIVTQVCGEKEITHKMVF